MSEGIKIITSDVVKVNVSNSQNDVVSFEKKFDKRQTISELKVSHKILPTGVCLISSSLLVKA